MPKSPTKSTKAKDTPSKPAEPDAPVVSSKVEAVSSAAASETRAEKKEEKIVPDTEMDNLVPVDKEHLGAATVTAKYAILLMICVLAFSIRLFAVVRYESVIHEFDPYFNFRTTKYLAHEGFLEFLDWFDDRGWYPLGRTIGGTIYPGIMFTAASFYWLLHNFHIAINIRNVCVFLAPVFAGLTSIASYLLTTEVTRRSGAGLLAAAFTAIVPSYISRSVGGSYDNEGVAIFALIFTFYLWVKAVHTGSMMWATLTALSYFYMVAAWGGYVFIINVIPIYVMIQIIAGKYSNRLYIAYSVFYVLGSLLAMQVPFVGFNVVTQAECMASHGMFLAIQVYAVVDYLLKIVDIDVMKRLFVTAALAMVGGMAVLLVSLQLLGKVTWTGRSLTLLDPTYASKYIPIVASVSEHQPTTWTSFFFDLHILVPLAPVGLFVLFNKPVDGAVFLILYGTIAWYFAGVMVRLMLTLAPIACILAAIGLSATIRKFANNVSTLLKDSFKFFDTAKNTSKVDLITSILSLTGPLSILVLLGITSLLCFFLYHAAYVSSVAYSNPSIVIEAGRTHDGTRVMYDDYREAYYWLRQNTADHSKILSWWDYGYQMSAMANRSVLVDNNTWNNTHIATVGRALASTEEKAYPIFESLDADYVLVIFGGLTGYSSDDVNKFLWPVRIGSGVYPNDMPHERDYMSSTGGFDIGPAGSKTLHNCVAYKTCYHRFGEMVTEHSKPAGYDRARGREVGVKNIKLTTLEEVFTSEHWIVRIYKVLPRPIFDPFSSSIVKKKTSSPVLPTEVSAPTEQAEPQVSVRYIGCFGAENSFLGRVYNGGTTGANINLAVHHAQAAKKKFIAVSRNAGDGHCFAFDSLSPRVNPQGDQRGGGCERPCLDHENFVCGCSDESCTGAKPAGEEHNRRWAVYEVL